jgi:chromosomal replication initiator protein
MTEIWPAILKQIEEKLDPKELSTWFGPTRQISFDASAGSGVLTISVPSRVFADWIESRHGALLAREAAAAGYPGLEIRFESGAADPPPASAPTPAPSTAGSIAANPRFSFESFVVGPSNQFAHAAARAVAEAPSRPTTRSSSTAASASARPTSCTPSAQDVLRSNPHASVLYLSSERFMNDLINASASSACRSSSERYRSSSTCC